MVTSRLLTRLLRTVLLVTPLVALTRRWTLPPGTVLVLVAPATLGMAVLFSGTGLPVVEPTLANLLPAAVTDLLVMVGRPGPERP